VIWVWFTLRLILVGDRVVKASGFIKRITCSLCSQKHPLSFSYITSRKILCPLSRLGYIWDVMLVWRKGNINRTLYAAVLCLHLRFGHIACMDLVLPVPLGTSSSSLAPFWTVSCNIFNFLPVEVDPLQILLESSAPRLLGASCFTPAIQWSPGYCHICRLMIWY